MSDSTEHFSGAGRVLTILVPRIASARTVTEEGTLIVNIPEHPRPRRRAALLALATTLAVTAGAMVSAPAMAAPAAADETHTATYTCLGLTQTFGVPPGVTSLSVVVQGAAGGGDRAGGGQQINAQLAVTPGQELLVKVGCRPRARNEGTAGLGFTPGGPAGKLFESSSVRFGGGGSSAIGTGTDRLDMQPLIVAGGGGGAGGENTGSLAARGGRGGVGGFPGVDNSGATGGGSGGAAGGVGYASSRAGAPGADSPALGGKPGGGGGGGYPRGGAGGQAAAYPGAGGGGAGGESWWRSGVVTGVSGSSAGVLASGKVVISWTGPAAPTQIVRCSGAGVTYTVPLWARAVSVITIGSSGGASGYTIASGRGTGFVTRIPVSGGSQLTAAAGCLGGQPTDGSYGSGVNPGGAGGFGIIAGSAGGGGGKLPGSTSPADGGWGGGGASGVRLPSGQVVAAAGGGGNGGQGAECGALDVRGGDAAFVSFGYLGTNGAKGCDGASVKGSAGGVTPYDRAVTPTTGGTSSSANRGGGGGGGGGGYWNGGGGQAGGFGAGGGAGGGGWTYVASPPTTQTRTVELDGYFLSDPVLYGANLQFPDYTKAAGIVIITPLRNA